MAKKILPSLFTFLWVLMICVLGLYYIFFAPRGSEYSPDENRTLAGFPDVSFDSVFSGKFGQAFETYLLDRFPARNKVISATNKLQSDLSFASHDEYLMIAEGPNDALDTDIDQSELDDLLSAYGENLQAFLGEELITVSNLGGIRLKYHSIWVCLLTIGGFTLMLLGAWTVAP